jgi:hypothetical protein
MISSAFVLLAACGLCNAIVNYLPGYSGTVKVHIVVDDAFTLYWNAQSTGQLNGVNDFVLGPNADCEFQNVLAIDASDGGGAFYVLMEVTYNNKTLQTGIAPEILLAPAATVTDAQWYLNPISDPNIWKPSNTIATCQNQWVTGTRNSNNFKSTTGGSWAPDCSSASCCKHVYLKVVIPTACGCRCASGCGY